MFKTKPIPNANGDILLIGDHNQNDIQYRRKSQFIRKRRMEYLKLKGQRKKERMKKMEQVTTKVVVKQQQDAAAAAIVWKEVTNSEKCAREKVKSLIIKNKNTEEKKPKPMKWMNIASQCFGFDRLVGWSVAWMFPIFYLCVLQFCMSVFFFLLLFVVVIFSVVHFDPQYRSKCGGIL